MMKGKKVKTTERFILLVPLAVGLGMLGAQVLTNRLPWWWAPLFVWVASPAVFMLFALAFEMGPVRQGYRGVTLKQVLLNVFNHEKQSWAFLYGDTIVLPLAALFIAHGWASGMATMSQTGLLWSFMLCAVIGAAAGWAFHEKLERPGYTKAGYAASLDGWTKFIHDFVTYPVISGVLLFAGVPLLVTVHGWWFWQWDWRFNWHTIPVLVLIGTWAVLGMVCDGRRAIRLIPWGHPEYDPEREECFISTLRITMP